MEHVVVGARLVAEALAVLVHLEERLGLQAVLAGVAREGVARLHVGVHGTAVKDQRGVGLLEHIQEELTLTRNTVKTYIKRIYGKLGVHSQQELIDLVEAGAGR